MSLSEQNVEEIKPLRISGAVIYSVFLLLIVLSFTGCASIKVQMYPGNPQTDQHAMIHGERITSCVTAPRIQILRVDGTRTMSFFKFIIRGCSAWPDTAYVLPGKHVFSIFYPQAGFQFVQDIWLIAKPQEEYVIRHRFVGYSPQIWVEEEKTGKVVGGLVGSADEPKPLDFREASDEVNAKAREQLEAIVASSGNLDVQKDLVATNSLICGPFLWIKLQPYAAMRGINWAPAHFRIPYTDDKTGDRKVENLEGRILQSGSEVLEFCGALHYEVTPTTNDVIRRLNQVEKEQLWAMVPFEYLEEPIFMIEGTDHKLMTMMIEDHGRYVPFWMDDFQWFSTNLTAQTVEQR